MLHKSKFFVGVAACTCLLAVPAKAEIVWRGDFETGDLSQWNETTGPVDTRVTFVGDPVRQGRLAARVEIQPGDLGNGNLNRVEFGHHPEQEGFDGSERWFAFSVMTTSDAPIGPSWHAFTYWEAEVLYTPAITYRLYAGNELQFCTHVGGEEVRWTTVMQPDVWHDFVMHVVWSPDPSIGSIELWYDGEQVVAPTTMATMFSDGMGGGYPNFLHQGMLRDETLTGTEVLFYDRTLEATDEADVFAPEGTTTGDGGGETTGGSDGPGSTTTAGTDPDTGTTSPGDAASDDTSAVISGSEATSAMPREQASSPGGCGCTTHGDLGSSLLPFGLLVSYRRRRGRQQTAHGIGTLCK